tara:strand:- start:539 stop:742 length:204 start_codon:yes stop_codon:yes gene_type:complete
MEPSSEQYKEYAKYLSQKRREEKVECECGRTTNKVDLPRHLRTPYHIKRINNNNEVLVLKRLFEAEF